MAGALVQGVAPEDRGLWKEFLSFMNEKQQQAVTLEIAASQSNVIIKDCQNVGGQYKNMNFFDTDLMEWLADRNGVVVNFFAGIINGSTGQSVSDLSEAELYKLVHMVENVYGICHKNIICPFSFMQNVSLYTTTNSRYGSSLLNATQPCGSYTSLQSTLNETFAAVPAKIPPVDCMTVFDNEQVIGKKSGIQPSQKARCSVITNLAYVKLDSESQLQQMQNVMQKNWFQMKGFEAKMKFLKGNELENLSSERNVFLQTVQSIINQDADEDLEKTHYTQLYYFVDAALKDVQAQQIKVGDHFRDDIDDQVEVRGSDTIQCEICGKHNPKRKLICDGCKEKEGLKAAREKKTQQTCGMEPVRGSMSYKTKATEFNYDADQVKTTRFVCETEDCKYAHVQHGHKNVKEMIILDPIYANPNSFETIAMVLRQIGLENGIYRYGGTMRHWTFVVCDGLPHTPSYRP